MLTKTAASVAALGLMVTVAFASGAMNPFRRKKVRARRLNG